MKLIDKTALIEKLKDKVCIFPTVVRRAIEYAPVVTVDDILEVIPDIIDTDAGTHLYLTYQERLKIATNIMNNLGEKLEAKDDN